MFLNGASDKDVRSILTLLSEKKKEHDKQGFMAFVFFLDGTPDQLKKLNKELKLDNIALCLLTDKERQSTLKGYGINPKAKSTFLIYDARVLKDKVVNYDAQKNAAYVKKAIDKICR